jgi:4-hydroxybenzoyl-CoA reductase subunit beta
MRLPRFRYCAPRSLAEAADLLAAAGSGAAILAGGTDLLPNMKRRQRTPELLVSLRHLDELRQVHDDDAETLRLGSGLSLATVAGLPAVRERHRALWQAAAQVASPHLRSMGTLGGNLCLDTRCGYYDQTESWRTAIGFCLKAKGETCWVAPSSRSCLAVSSTDCAPALIALGARVRLVDAEGSRELPLADLYRHDGKEYLTLRPAEILTEVVLPERTWTRSTYWKLSRRGSFDFPVLGVGAAVSTADDGTVTAARIALGAVLPRPVLTEAGDVLVGQRLTDDVIAEAARVAARAARPMDNTDLDPHWRKKAVPAFVTYALCELRGDDLTDVRQRYHQPSSVA